MEVSKYLPVNNSYLGNSPGKRSLVTYLPSSVKCEYDSHIISSYKLLRMESTNKPKIIKTCIRDIITVTAPLSLLNIREICNPHVECLLLVKN